MRAIHRDDGELCGFVQQDGERWRALTVFGAVLATDDSSAAAEAVVRQVGLASLAERWLLVTPDAPDEEIVCIQEASPVGVTVALGYSSMPGVPTRRITRDEIDRGTVRLRRDQ
jgi:hypothetical protein